METTIQKPFLSIKGSPIHFSTNYSLCCTLVVIVPIFITCKILWKLVAQLHIIVLHDIPHYNKGYQ